MAQTLEFRFIGDNRNLRKAVQGADRDLGTLEARGTKTGHGLSKAFGIAGAAAGGALALGLKGAVTAAAGFEKQMSALGAVSDASAKQMTAFRKAALKAGADTAFSAKEA